MTRLLLFFIASLFLIFIQGYLLYALHMGGANNFIELWKSFGISVPTFTKLIFFILPYWWLPPILCLAQAVIFGTVLRQRFPHALAFSFGVTLVITVSVYWSVYGYGRWVS